MKAKVFPFLCLVVTSICWIRCDDDPFTVEQCIRTENVSNIGMNSATAAGKIICDCGLAVTERGVYWSGSPRSETTGTRLAIGSGVGSFSSDLSCLTPNTTYYVKAYAINSKGTFFGREVSFTTLPNETFLDARDGQVYKTVKIGTQVWMAQNLNYSMPGNSFCYGDDSANCSEYGRLYLWDEAILAVPPGWHLPSRSEFEDLIANFPSAEEAYNQLIVEGCSGFDSKFAGIRNHVSPIYFGLGVYADYWSTTETGPNDVLILDLNTTDKRASIAPDRKKRGFSVRCIKDASETH